ncbi:MAG: MipA/OmpV family protein [Psychromonas sp.]|nr:MipA/OmpV family protein [Psychromonas sp.]
MKYLVIIGFFFTAYAFAGDTIKNSNLDKKDQKSPISHESWPHEEPEWGIAIGERSASIPFTATDNKHVNDFITKYYYEGEYVFLRGDRGGVHFYKQPRYNFSGIAQMRFLDIPERMQNEFNGSKIDAGLQLEYFFMPKFPIQYEYLSDLKGHNYGKINLRYAIDYQDFDFKLYSTVRLKSANFNNLYYGLDGFPKSKNPDGTWNWNEINDNKIGSDYDISVGMGSRYHVWRNLYLLAEAKVTRLGRKTYRSSSIDTPFQSEYYLGFGFFKDKKRKDELTLPHNQYIRWAYGWGTTSNLNDVLTGHSQRDPYNNQMTSFFYGFPLTENIFGSGIELFLTPGFVWHFKSENQPQLEEYVLAMKAYYTIKWPLRWRLGLAEGLSYTTDITGLERTEIIDEKGYAKASKLLNYLDFSLDVNLGDITTVKKLDNLWLGYSIHHRSAIFEDSSLFGRIKGGSNYNSAYLQWHF